MNGSDLEAIQKATEKVSESFYPIAQKMYQNTADAQSQEGAQHDSGATEGDNVVDAAYEVVDEADQK